MDSDSENIPGVGHYLETTEFNCVAMLLGSAMPQDVILDLDSALEYEPLDRVESVCDTAREVAAAQQRSGRATDSSDVTKGPEVKPGEKGLKYDYTGWLQKWKESHKQLLVGTGFDTVDQIAHAP